MYVHLINEHIFMLTIVSQVVKYNNFKANYILALKSQWESVLFPIRYKQIANHYIVTNHYTET